MATISLFTPTHNSRWLEELYASIKDQPFHEWVIVYNNGAEVIEFNDPRVKSYVLPVAAEWVGPLKAYACEQCTGDVLLEMDHDDLLLPGAIQAVSEAFDSDSSIGFVYSNALFVDGEGKRTKRFDAGIGWEYREHEYNGETVDELVSFPPSVASCSLIWFAPNHIRAFLRTKYLEIGGYAKDMRVLDDQDLMSRLYQVARFHWIDAPLYVYRIHGQNSWLKHNQEIQDNVWRLYEKYVQPMARSWSTRSGLLSLDLGGRIDAPEGYKTVDLRDADFLADLNERWPFEDGTVGCVRAADIFEHLKDPIHVMKELYRVLAPGGYAFIQVPSTDGRGAFQDPTHVSYWNENSFLYYTDAAYNRYIDCEVKFQVLRLYTTAMDARQTCWAVAHLVKDGSRIPGRKLL